MRVDSFELQQNLTPADWVVERIHPFGVDVGSIIPDGFDAYVRLLHPAFRDEASGEVPVTWAEIAAANGRVVHSEMQWPNISGVWEHSWNGAPGLWDRKPEIGSLPRNYAVILAELLAEYTSSPDRVWFCVWDGWGGLKFHPVGRAVLSSSEGRWRSRRAARRRARLPAPAPTVQLPNRSYYLLAGPIGAITESLEDPPMWQTANLWWPDDRSWCVATEIDFAWSYLGGSDDLIAKLSERPDLEVIRAMIDHGITYRADQVNPPPPGNP